MKEAIAILTGGGPAPGMNTVVGSVAKTFLRKGYRVIGLHEGYTGLFNPSPRPVDIDYPMADGIFNQGGSFLQMSRFKPKDSDFENNFNLCELGPRSTGKSHIYKEISPNSILVSGGQTTEGNMLYDVGR